MGLYIGKSCNLCGKCVDACPFHALSLQSGKLCVGDTCRLCGICVRNCPQHAIVLEKEARPTVDKSQWKGIMVLAEQTGGTLHPVSMELLGEARRLADPIRHPVYALLLGKNIGDCAETLCHYGADRVFPVDDPELEVFRADVYADAAAGAIRRVKPAVVLVGATAAGRSLAPRLSVRMRTGLTADCTQLGIKPNTDLVQIRPAFGGNIMAQIVTTNTRPQFATVRYKVMKALPKTEKPCGVVEPIVIPGLHSDMEIRALRELPKSLNISECEVLVAAGRGVRDKKDLELVEQLADALGGQLACSRPLVEMGWMPHARQIGLSGRTVKPKLLITCGVSGAVQFTAAMDGAECIVAINRDPEAQIFRVAHYGIVGDLYEVVPRLIRRIREGGAL